HLGGDGVAKAHQKPAVIVPCKPDGTAIGSPADSFAAALGMTAYDAAQTPGIATDPATVSLKTYGNGTQGDAVAEFYYTYASGKSDADCNNTTFQLRSAYGSFGDAAFAKYGAGESTLKKQGFTYPNSTVQVLGAFRLEGPDTIAVPTNGTADLQVKLVAMDTLGNPMQDMKLTRSIAYPAGSSTGWTERSAGTGFAFTLGQTVQSGTLKLAVTDQKTNRTAEKSVIVAKALPVAKNVFIGGGDSTITTEEGETASRSYSATVVDQYGEAIPGANVTWGGTPPSNCTRSGETVTVGATVRPGTYYFNLTATSGGAHDSIRVTIKVTSKVVPPPKPTPTQPPKPNPGGGGGGGGGGVVPPVPEVDADVPAETLKESPAITVTPKAVAGAGGVYTATLTPDELAAINLAMTGSRGAVVIAPQVGADATGVAVTLPKTAVSALSARGGRGMELRSSLGTISLNCGALTAAAAAAGENLTVSTSAVGGDKSILKVEMMAGDNSLQSLAGGVTLTAPVPAALGTTGLVAVLVAADGTETVVRKSAAVKGDMVVPLSGGATVKLKSVPSPFTDMDGHWAADSAAFTSARGLFTGITPATFVPGDDMTRGMVVTVLHRLEDLPHAGQPAVFQDVASDAWYTDAVSWAADSGIVQGSGGGFLPGDNVSREQLATMLYRYAKQQKLSVAGQKNLAKFPDGTDVSSWSQDAMSWAVAAGLFAGGDDGRLNPGGTASRAEVAIILERFVTFAAKER
ncbi:MAG: S-layer homology domain-containing protein, partial [Oscillospiraceae bacterium]